MYKGNKKRYDSVRAIAVTATAKEFGISEAYVRMLIDPRDKRRQNEDIVHFYRKKYKQIKAAITNHNISYGN